MPSAARKLGAADVAPGGIFSQWASKGFKYELRIRHTQKTVGVSTA